MSSLVMTAMHAGTLRRRARVDLADAAVRDGAAEDFSVQHARQAEIVRVFGAAGDLGAGLKPREWIGRPEAWSARLRHGALRAST